MLEISLQWTVEEMTAVASSMDENTIVACMKPLLEAANGIYILQIFNLLDVCMKTQILTLQKPVVFLLRNVFHGPKFHVSQTLEERDAINKRIAYLLNYWERVGLLPMQSSKIPNIKSGYFARKFAHEEYVLSAQTKTEPHPLMSFLPCQPEDSRFCTVCGQIMEIFFSDQANQWLYKDANAHAQLGRVHVDCF
jgi:hypothetical protein